MFERRLFFHVDWALLTAILLLAGIGVAMIYSTTYVTLPSGEGHAGAQVRTQMYALAIGLTVLLSVLTHGFSARPLAGRYGQTQLDRPVTDHAEPNVRRLVSQSSSRSEPAVQE